jgi:hypothetical protein
MRDLTETEIDLIRRALGFHLSRKRIGPVRNRLSCHINGETIAAVHALEDLGVMTHAADLAFGKMRVFQVTPAGFAAIGIAKIPKGLRVEPPFREPTLKIAA